jgi:outer membrane receptor for monomeric catechols
VLLLLLEFFCRVVAKQGMQLAYRQFVQRFESLRLREVLTNKPGVQTFKVGENNALLDGVLVFQMAMSKARSLLDWLPPVSAD